MEAEFVDKVKNQEIELETLIKETDVGYEIRFRFFLPVQICGTFPHCLESGIRKNYPKQTLICNQVQLLDHFVDEIFFFKCNGIP